jgi:hypothetical protein
MRVLLITAIVVGGLSPRQMVAPEVTPFLSDGAGAGFVVEMKNTTGSELVVISALGRCRFRLDGVDENRSGGGSSGGVRVAPGDSWREV